MTKRDEKLIDVANACHCDEWMYVSNGLAPLAETEEARAELKRIASRLYHAEEYTVGAL